MLGCASEGSSLRPPQAVAATGTAPPDEIDGRALGLDQIVLDDSAVVHARWQREIYPRYLALQEADRGLPAGLASWIRDFDEMGETATDSILGITEFEYLQALGYYG